jgi:hypothetical protein
MSFKLLKILLIVLIILLKIPLFPAIMFDPELEWRSIKTRHFWIHYHQGLEGVAKKFSQLAERVHGNLVKDTKWEPYWRTDVVLVDNMDLANGFAMPMPFNRVQIYISRPELDSVLNNFYDSLEMVFVHEYTHVLNVDTIHGIPAISRYTCGRICFPNLFLPTWITEGNAVYHESRNSIYGRNNSSYTDMVMRVELLSKTFKSIYESSHFPRRWPEGNVPYLYGGLFVDYLEKKYGRDSFAGIFIENSDNIIPFLISKNAYDIYGNSFITLWEEWEEYIGIKYKNQISELRAENLTSYRKLTESGLNTNLPRFSGDGSSLYYVRLTNYNKPALMQYSLKEGSIAKLCAVHYPNSLSVSRNGEVFLSDLEFYRSFSLYSESYKFDGAYRKLTSRLRGTYLDISQGDKAIFVTNKNNRYSIILSDTNFKEFRPLIQDSDVQFAFTKFSPDDKRIAFSIKDRRGFSDIVMMHIDKKEIYRITDDRFNDIDPTWHPDGDRIIFTSDRNGVYNLYEFNVTRQTISRLTNLLGGAFSPDISPDGRLIAFSSYEKNGFDISLMEYPRRVYSEAATEIKKIGLSDFKPKSEDPNRYGEITSSDYTAWKSIINPLWIPWIYSEEIYEDKYEGWYGFMTWGSDALYRHFYSLAAFISDTTHRGRLFVQYALSSFYPDFIIEYEDDSLFYGKDDFPWEDDNRTTTKRKMTRSGAFGMAIPFNYFNSIHQLLITYNYEKTYTDLYIPLVETRSYRDTLVKIAGAYYFSNAKIYSYSVSQEDGRVFYIISDNYSGRIGSDLSFYKIRGEYSEYLPGIGRNNVIMLRLRGGASFDNPDYLAPYNLGRFEKGKKGSVASDEDQFGLRGYPSGMVYGNRLAVGTLEYRLPLLQFDFGYETAPLLFRDIWLTVFAEYGNVWMEDTAIKDFRSSAGLELHMKITLGYRYDLQGYIGFSRGFNTYGEDQLYFGVNTIYEGAFDSKKLIDLL